MFIMKYIIFYGVPMLINSLIGVFMIPELETSFASFSFLAVAFFCGCIVHGTIVGRCIKDMEEYSLSAPLIGIIIILYMFPVFAFVFQRKIIAAPGTIISVFSIITLILFSILGIIPGIIFSLFNTLLSALAISEEVSACVVLVIVFIACVGEGAAIGGWLADKLGNHIAGEGDFTIHDDKGGMYTGFFN